MWYATWASARLYALEMHRSMHWSGIHVSYAFLLLAVFMIARVSLGHHVVMVLDLGLAAMTLLLNVIAIIAVIQQQQREQEQRCLYLLLSRVPSRLCLYFGRYMGFLGLFSIHLLALWVLWAGLVFVLGWQALPLLQVLCALWAELAIVLALAMLFAQASSVFLALLFSLALDVAGRYSFTILQFSHQHEGLNAFLLYLMYLILPNFDAVNIRQRLDASLTIPMSDILHVLTYGLIEAGFLLLLGCVFFAYKDLR